jgi:hypothetical protein
VLSDLAALTPPFLVAAAFLIAVGAFLRHEMRAAKNHADELPDEVQEVGDQDHVDHHGSGDRY